MKAYSTQRRGGAKKNAGPAPVTQRLKSLLARISHTLSAAARDKAASTSLRSLTVLDVLFKYASAR
jgi:hypothetical protein